MVVKYLLWGINIFLHITAKEALPRRNALHKMYDSVIKKDKRTCRDKSASPLHFKYLKYSCKKVV